MPAEILSDRGAAFLSGLMKEVENLLGFHKVNTTAYHPQTDGLVERFNRTLTTMLAKTTERGGKDWDRHLPYVLFAYRASQKESTLESLFFLLYGRDPRLPTEIALSPTNNWRMQLDLKEYGVDLVSRMSGAWESAKSCISKAQKRQKKYYDCKSRSPDFAAGDRVFLLRPEERTGEARKLNRPFHGPYRVVSVTTNDAKIRRVDSPKSDPILVALDRLRRCPDEVGDKFWPGRRKKRGRPNKSPPQTPAANDDQPMHRRKGRRGCPRKDQPPPPQLGDGEGTEQPRGPAQATTPNKWTGRLRNRQLGTVDA